MVRTGRSKSHPSTTRHRFILCLAVPITLNLKPKVHRPPPFSAVSKSTKIPPPYFRESYRGRRIMEDAGGDCSAFTAMFRLQYRRQGANNFPLTLMHTIPGATLSHLYPRARSFPCERVVKVFMRQAGFRSYRREYRMVELL
jgi:hypothetical protein